jgi:hypothetical protein
MDVAEKRDDMLAQAGCEKALPSAVGCHSANSKACARHSLSRAQPELHGPALGLPYTTLLFKPAIRLYTPGLTTKYTSSDTYWNVVTADERLHKYLERH